MKLKVEYFVCNPFQELCYVVWDEVSRHCMMVDPGMASSYEWFRVKNFLATHTLSLDAVLITHSHIDHVMGTGFVRSEYPDIPIYGSMQDQQLLPPVSIQSQLFGVDIESQCIPISKNLIGGEEWIFAGDHRVVVYDCPGHSFHGLCYYFPDDELLFSGDVLFCSSVGRSDFGPNMGCDGRLLIEGIVQKLLTLPNSVIVYPGHGPNTTIGYEASYNPYIL